MTDIHTIPFKEGKYPTVTVLLQHQINVVSKSAQGTVYGFKPLLLFLFLRTIKMDVCYPKKRWTYANCISIRDFFMFLVVTLRLQS
jgi:hypothetical protein